MKTVILTPPAEHLNLKEAITFQPTEEGELVFPDGEAYFRLKVPENTEKAYIVHSGSPHPNRGLFQFFSALEKLKEENIPREAIFTYFPYGMQDKTFTHGELNLARVLLSRIQSYCQKIYIINPHFSTRGWSKNYSLEVLDAMDLFLDGFDPKDFLLVGPDEGAGKKFNVSSFRKERSGSYDVEIQGELEDKVEGEKVMVIDDIIETGGTMCQAAEKLREKGAERVEAAAVHGVLEKGIERVKKSYDRLWLTNSIDNNHFQIKVEPLLREAIS